MNRLQKIDWGRKKKDSFNLFTKLIRTKDPSAHVDVPNAVGQRSRLSKCLSTMDLMSLGVGSCVGTGMYLVTGMVARKIAGPGVIISFIIAAAASIFSGASYAEFGVRVPHTSGSAYMYSYVTVGEFVAFVIGWNMQLEYLIGTSACARALSASFDAVSHGSLSEWTKKHVGTFNGEAPDLFAFVITLLMMLVLLAGVKKSLIFNNVLNIINFSVWVFIMTAGLFYVNSDNWTKHNGFLPFGWSGVFTGAATCFYAFIGFDIIATTGEEATNPKRSIPLAIVGSLAIILCAYVTSSIMLTLIVPYERVDEDSALVEMFGYVGAPTCKYIVAVGAIAGLTVSMFGSMFPMPRIVYAMAQDGLVFRQLSAVWEATGTPALATCVGGIAASLVALVIRLEILVEMMSIGTLLAYTLVSTCVLILRYQPHTTNLIELLPQRLRTPIFDTEQTVVRETAFGTATSESALSSPDSDDSLPGDEIDDYGRDDQFLVSDNTENTFYGSVHGTPGAAGGGTGSRYGALVDFLGRKLQALSYLCPALFPWVDLGPATESSGMFVMKCVGMMYLLIIAFDLLAAYGSPGASSTTSALMLLLLLGMLVLLLMISKKPQNRNPMLYMTPGLPFVPTIAVAVNIYLTLNLSILTLVRFTVWMTIGMFVYFKYGIKNSTLAQQQPPDASDAPSPQPHSVLDHKVIPPRPANPPSQSRNIFEGNLADMYAAQGFRDPLLAWDEAETKPSSNSRVAVEQRYNARTNSSSSHAAAPAAPAPAAAAATASPGSSGNRPPWAYANYPTWDD